MRAPATLILLAVLLVPVAADARGGGRNGLGLGLGLELGAPTGLSLRYYTRRDFAVQGGLGYIHGVGDHGNNIHVEAVWIPTTLARQPDFDLNLYVGVGGRLLDDTEGHDDVHLGVRAPLGITFDLRRVPFDFFIELAAVVDFLRLDHDDDDHDHDFDLNITVGARFWF